MARQKKYRDEEGNYLRVVEGPHDYLIAWFIMTIGDYGSCLGDDPDCVGYMAAKPFADSTRQGMLVFYTEKQARRALQAANAALIAAAGWTPPENWKP